MGLGVHLSDAELRALLLRKAGSTPEQAAHFFLCGPCRERALGTHPVQARGAYNPSKGMYQADGHYHFGCFACP